MDFVISKLKKYRFFSDLMDEKALKQFKKYLVTGFLSFGTEYGLFYLLHKRLGLWYLTANIAVYIVIFWLNFLMNRMWSFKSTQKLSRQLPLYSGLFVFNLLATSGLIYLLSDLVGINPMISKVLVMGAVVSWNFILYKKVIYKT